MKKISRRNFVKTSLIVPLIGGNCLSHGLKEALAEVERTGKPLLTEENLNKLFANREANKALAAEALKNIKEFIRRRFVLTPLQSKCLDGIPRWAERAFQNLLRPVGQNGGSVVVRIIEDSPDRKGCKLEVEPGVKGKISLYYYRCS